MTLGSIVHLLHSPAWNIQVEEFLFYLKQDKLGIISDIIYTEKHLPWKPGRMHEVTKGMTQADCVNKLLVAGAAVVRSVDPDRKLKVLTHMDKIKPQDLSTR